MNYYWIEMNKLKYECAEEFEKFYNDFIIILNKLNKIYSIAVTDNSFLCSLVFHKIDISDLVTEISIIILNKKDEKCKDILQEMLKEANPMANGYLSITHPTLGKAIVSA